MSTQSASLTYCGHSAFILTTERGTRIAIDPFLSINPICPSDLKKPENLDAIVLTHGHADHVGDTLALASAQNVKIFATFELAQLLIKDGADSNNVIAMNKGGQTVFSSSKRAGERSGGNEGGKTSDSTGSTISIALVNAFHSSSYTDREGNTHYAGEPCGAVIRLESGRAIYHAGDTCFFQDMAWINEYYQPEVAIVPIGDHYTMGPEEAAHAVSVLKPRFAIPMHFATFPVLTGEPEEFSSHLAKLPTSPVIMAPGASFELPEL